jgi:hypothetical protein
MLDTQVDIQKNKGYSQGVKEIFASDKFTKCFFLLVLSPRNSPRRLKFPYIWRLQGLTVLNSKCVKILTIAKVFFVPICFY